MELTEEEESMRAGECGPGVHKKCEQLLKRNRRNHNPAQSLRAREAEWELGTFATDKYRSSLTTSRNHYAA